MKKYLLTLALLFSVTFIFAQGETPPTITAEPAIPPTTIEWDEMTHQFGKVEQGKPVTAKFWFTNTGENPVKITNVKKTCGCTTPGWSKEEVAPGERGYVTATYNAAREGSFNKGIVVSSTSTTPNQTLYLKGEVLKKEVVNFNDNSIMSTGSQEDGQ